MDTKAREAAARKEIGTYRHDQLVRIAFAAWQYHRETNTVCPVCEGGVSDDPAECICDWQDTTRRQADDVLDSLLPA